MAAHQDADELFDAHLGVLNAAVSFSERLRRARQLDAFLETFADAEDSGDEEWGGASLPRGTVAVAAARAQPSLANQPFSSSTSECASAATTRIASGCSSASTSRAPPTPDQSGPHPPAVYHAGAEMWIAEASEAETFGASTQPRATSERRNRTQSQSRPASALRRQRRREAPGTYSY
tara:strand:- start:1838 stop:2371 length:534 start_codon:yes stop_codon:yes gene_type:complete